jgi:hypothetical protein
LSQGSGWIIICRIKIFTRDRDIQRFGNRVANNNSTGTSLVAVNKSKFSNLARCITLSLFFLLPAANAMAALEVEILESTTTTVTLSISGTLDTDTTGPSPGYIGLKPFFTGNQGVNIPWFDISPTVTGDLLIGGAIADYSSSSTDCYGDAVYWINPDGVDYADGSAIPIPEDTSIYGTITLSGAQFDPDATAGLELVAGEADVPGCSNAWARSEAVAATPAPPAEAIELQILESTTSTVTISIRGTFDTDTIGSAPGYIGLKPFFTGNQGVNTPWFDAVPSVTGSLIIGGASAYFDDGSTDDCYGDSLWWYNPDGVDNQNGTDVAITAGTSIYGTITLSGAQFDPTATAGLELVTGETNVPGCDDAWARSDASIAASTPATPTVALVGSPPAVIPAMPVWMLGFLAAVLGYLGIKRHS